MQNKTIRLIVTPLMAHLRPMSFSAVLILICMLRGTTVSAVNPVRTVSQVKSSVVISSSVDYHITSPTPFSASGSIDIRDTDHAVLIFDALRPSEALTWLSYVKVDGTEAVSGTNCQVRIYGRGTIVYPYARNFRPLTVYDEENLQGNSANTFNLSSNNGFMNNLTSGQMNNRIKSFSLKRGYMVTFAMRKGGYGYSRCFIADNEDLEVTLPVWQQDRFSSYRLFKWNDVSKCGWGGTQVECMSALNATWCYEWGAPDPQNIDWECVPQHHHEGWPAIDEVGRNGTSCHALGNNEPDNTADASEQYQTVEQVLANWPQMMATGKRLGTPAMAGNRAWLKEFCDSIDARGWRCDFCAVHLYFGGNEWDWDWQVNDYYGQSNQRPIWITEMNTGAEWTDWWGGSDRSANASNYQIQKDHFAPVLDMLMNHDKVERIAPFNSFWSDKCRMFYNWDDADPVTPIGHYYAELQSPLAYSGRYDKIPGAPRLYGPQEATLSYKPGTKTNVITWKDVNGEFNTDMWVERREGTEWTRIMTAKQAEEEGSYTCRDAVGDAEGYVYRVALKTVFSNKVYYSPILGSVSSTTRPMTSDEDVQWGVMESAGTDATANFSSPFAQQPAIVFGSPSNVNCNVAPCEQVKDITKRSDGSYSKMTFRFFPWQIDTPTAFTEGMESSAFIAAAPGTGRIGTLRYESGYVTDNAKASDILSYTFSQPFDEVPVVMASPYYNGTAYPFVCRVFDVTTEGFKVMLQCQKGVGSKSQTAAVAFFAIEQGETLDALNRKIWVKTAKKRFTSSTATSAFTFSQHLKNPTFLVQMQSMSRQDVVCITRLINPGGDDVASVRIALLLDPTADIEVTVRNPITETFGCIAISETDDTINGIAPLSPFRGEIRNSKWYDLSGRQIDKSSNCKLPRGIYIVNGKKYIK